LGFVARRAKTPAPSGSEGESDWFAASSTPTPAKPIAALQASGLTLLEDTLLVTEGAVEARVPLKELRTAELDVRVRAGRMALVLTGAALTALLVFLVFGLEHVDLALLPLAVAVLMVRRLTVAGALELELRAGGVRRVPLAPVDTKRLRQAGRAGPSFLATLRARIEEVE
jgi:hypothetical protein